MGAGDWGATMDDDDLHDAFSTAYWDFCNSSGCKYDPEILKRLWFEFLRDMQQGFASLFRTAQ
jgi:hypothetical protein